MHGRWVTGMTNTFADDLRLRPGLPVSQALRQLLLSFTMVLAGFVARIADSSLGRDQGG